jgi:hypothetical protein
MLLALADAPQRTTLYGDLARFLVVPELLASPLGARVRDHELTQLGGLDFLLVDLDEPTPEELALLDHFGTVAGVYEYFPALGDLDGPFLRPVEGSASAFLPPELIETRRYRGKTNELFTMVLLNLAIFASDFADQLGERLRVLDPLSGGGTTLFTALVRGYDAFGIEREKDGFDTTDAYVQQFLRAIGIPYKRIEERVRGVGRRSLLTIGRRDATRTLGLIQGDTYATPDLLDGIPGGARFHAIVADLPYGIQHRGQVKKFLDDALPLWGQALLPGGAMALAWEASTTRRESAIDRVEKHHGLRVVDTPPFSELEHPVDRQIKRRDVLVIRREE